MLGVIENVNLRAHRLCCNEKLVERVVSGPVHFPFMVYLLDHLKEHIDLNCNIEQSRFVGGYTFTDLPRAVKQLYQIQLVDFGPLSRKNGQEWYR